jgi:predicted permease
MLKLAQRRSSALADELAEEMELHIQEKAESLEDAGMSPDEALKTARRAFGNQALLQDRSVEVWQDRLLTPLLFDLKAAVVHMRRFPALALTAVLVIALGIGANTAIFNVLYSATLKSLSVRDPKSLVFLQLVGPKINPAGINLTPKIFARLSSESNGFDGLAASVTARVTTADGTDNRSLPAAFVSDDFFDLLGVAPPLGRTFSGNESRQARHSNVWPIVLDYRFWKDRFAGRPSVIGKRITVSGHPAMVIGVAPASFDGLSPSNPPRLYLPIGFLFDDQGNAVSPPVSGAAAPVVLAVGRLKEGTTIKEANASLAHFNGKELPHDTTPYLQQKPNLDRARIRAVGASGGIRALDEHRSVLLFLQILMIAALLLCGINVTGLQLAISYERSHEFALRIALGANRYHLVRQCICEAFLLCFGGALLSLPIPVLSSYFLPTYLTRAGSADSPVLRLDWIAFAAAGTFLFLVTIVVGIAPAIFARRIHPAAVLKARSLLGRPPFVFGKLLVILQIALSFVLISAATFFIIRNHQLRDDELGFHPEHVVEVSAQFQWLPLSNIEIMNLYRKMLRRLRAEKEVESASLTWITPLTGTDIEMELRDARPSSTSRLVAFNQIGPAYFSTLQTEVIKGREFSDEDDDNSNCILNILAEQRLFSGRDSIDQHVVGKSGADFTVDCRVIGVVGNTKYADVHSPAVPQLYLPITASSLSRGGYERNMVFLIRAQNDAAIESAYRETLNALAPSTSYMRFLPMRVQVDQALGRDILVSLATTLFALIAIPMCGASVLSLMRIRVKHNAADIAIMVALGASPVYVAQLILRDSLLLFASGSALGMVTVFFSWHLMSPSWAQPTILMLLSAAYALLLLLGIAVLAGGLPAFQAARLRPMSLLCRDS